MTGTRWFWANVAGVIFLFAAALAGSLHLIRNWPWRTWGMVVGAVVPSLCLLGVTVWLVVRL